MVKYMNMLMEYLVLANTEMKRAPYDNDGLNSILNTEIWKLGKEGFDFKISEIEDNAPALKILATELVCKYSYDFGRH